MKAYQIVYYTLLIINIIVIGIRWKKLNQSSRWGATLIVVTILSELIAFALAKIYKQNLWWYHIFVIIQFVIILKTYQTELRQKKWQPIGVGMVLLIAGLSFTQPLKSFPSYSVACNSLFAIFCALFYLRAMLLKTEESFFTSYPLFWVSIGWLFFCTITLIDFSAYNYFREIFGKELRATFLNIRVGGNYLLYFLYLVSFFSKQKHL